MAYVVDGRSRGGLLITGTVFGHAASRRARARTLAPFIAVFGAAAVIGLIAFSPLYRRSQIAVRSPFFASYR